MKIFKASLILSKEVDFQINSIVNLISGSLGQPLGFLSSKQISSLTILTICPLDYHFGYPSYSYTNLSSSPGTNLILSSLGNIKNACFFLFKL